MMTIPPTQRIWIPRTTLANAPSAMALKLGEAGHVVLEQGWQHLETTPHMQDEAYPHKHEWLMLTSPLGVRFFQQWLQQHGQAIQPNVHTMVLGEGTARAWQATFNRPPEFSPPHTRDAQHLITTWLQHHPLPTAANTILWPCSQLSHVEALQHTLRQAGYFLHPWPLYFPSPYSEDAYSALVQKAVAFKPTMGILTSPSNIERLHQAGVFERFPRVNWLTLGLRSTQAVGSLVPHVSVTTLEAATAQAILNACDML